MKLKILLVSDWCFGFKKINILITHEEGVNFPLSSISCVRVRVCVRVWVCEGVCVCVYVTKNVKRHTTLNFLTFISVDVFLP